ncbi:hypothetical protein OC845_006386, partial [Tilletia horrida]
MKATRVGVFTDSSVRKLIPYQIFDKVRAEPSDIKWQAAIEFAQANHFSHLLAVRGGSVMDTAKCTCPTHSSAKILSLDMSALVAGVKFQDEYDGCAKAVFANIGKASNEGLSIILFIDEMYMITTGQGSSSNTMDLANLLKPMLARGQLRCRGATTLSKYRQYIEKDSALERRFQQVLVAEPSVNTTIAILRGISEKYEVPHGVRILDAAIVQAAILAKRYLTARRLPDSAIDLDIDQLERKRLQLQVAIHALEREKDSASKERLAEARKELAAVDEETAPKKAEYEANKAKGDEANRIRKRIDLG